MKRFLRIIRSLGKAENGTLLLLGIATIMLYVHQEGTTDHQNAVAMWWASMVGVIVARDRK